MMSGRPSTEHLRRRLKLATQRSVETCGAQEFVADITRVSAKTLSDYSNTGNERHTDTFMPVDVLADLILDCKARGEVPPLLVYLCELAGGRFEPVSPVRGSRDAIALVDSVLKSTMDLRSQLLDGEGAE